MVDTIPEDVRRILDQVQDPEIPVLSILDMGIVHTIEVKDKSIRIEIIPTYSGCPAMDMIVLDIQKAFMPTPYIVQVDRVLTPAWTTDMISPRGRDALHKYGIAPPLCASVDKAVLLGGAKEVPCPQCNSKNTHVISQFGSTPCKALFKCEDCLEPFDYFKCLK